MRKEGKDDKGKKKKPSFCWYVGRVACGHWEQGISGLCGSAQNLVHKSQAAFGRLAPYSQS